MWSWLCRRHRGLKSGLYKSCGGRRLYGLGLGDGLLLGLGGNGLEVIGKQIVVGAAIELVVHDGLNQYATTKLATNMMLMSWLTPLLGLGIDSQRVK